MYKLVSNLILSAVLATQFLSTPASMAREFSGIVTRVIDGDTILIDKKRIRLAGIDAPESDQPYGDESKAFLEYLILDKPVRIIWTETDFYKRIIGYVRIPKEYGDMNINSTMVLSGAAWSYMVKSDLKLIHYEQEARQYKRGLWSTDKPIKPSIWRRLKKKPAKTNQLAQPLILSS